MKAGIVIYPSAKQIFNAFNLAPFDKVKVVIIGQDPYHGKGQAHGLSFSVPNGIIPPPSLVNIFKEIESDLGVKISKTNGNLERVGKTRSAITPNAILTVRADSPRLSSQPRLGKMTDSAIKALSDKKSALFFSSGANSPKKKKI